MSSEHLRHRKSKETERKKEYCSAIGALESEENRSECSHSADADRLTISRPRCAEAPNVPRDIQNNFRAANETIYICVLRFALLFVCCQMQHVSVKNSSLAFRLPSGYRSPQQTLASAATQTSNGSSVFSSFIATIQ